MERMQIFRSERLCKPLPINIYYDFIKLHQGLKGKTPSEACGIKVEGKNKWKTLIQNASTTV